MLGTIVSPNKILLISVRLRKPRLRAPPAALGSASKSAAGRRGRCPSMMLQSTEITTAQRTCSYLLLLHQLPELAVEVPVDVVVTIITIVTSFARADFHHQVSNVILMMANVVWWAGSQAL